jgi:hypothetical protein
MMPEKYKAYYERYKSAVFDGWWAMLWTQDTYFGGYYTFKTEQEAKEAVEKFLERCRSKYDVLEK